MFEGYDENDEGYTDYIDNLIDERYFPDNEDSEE
jgi:hypothetical protein